MTSEMEWKSAGSDCTVLTPPDSTPRLKPDDKLGPLPCFVDKQLASSQDSVNEVPFSRHDGQGSSKERHADGASRHEDDTSSPCMESNAKFRKRFADLRSDIAIFQQSFAVLLNSLASVERDVICDVNVGQLPEAGSCCSLREDTLTSRLPESEDNDGHFTGFPPAISARWAFRKPTQKFVKAYSSHSSVTPASVSKLMRLHDRWDNLYLANEKAIREAEQAEQEKRANRPAQFRPSGMASVISWKSNREADVPIHPYSSGRIAWDVVGTIFVMMDVIVLPVSIAWELETRVGTFEHHLLTTTIIYWLTDMVLSANTSYMDRSGILISSRRRVMRKYFRTWFSFDVVTVTLDCFIWLFVSTDFGAIVRGVRVIRMLRLARGLRVLKLVNLNRAIENLGSVRGRQALILVLAFIRTMTSIFFLAHILACIWYAIGKSEESNGNPNWLSLLQERDGVVEEYIQSLAWILGYLTANTVDGRITPRAFSERIFMLHIALASLVVLGCGIGKITETMLAIEKINSESTRAKRVLERFLKANEVPVDLRMRVMGFVLHRIQQKSEASLDADLEGLLSSSLASELLLSQRLKHIIVYPLFNYFQENQPVVMLHLCKAFDNRIIMEEEPVFMQSAWADVFVITRHGIFLHFDNDERKEKRYRISISSSDTLLTQQAFEPLHEEIIAQAENAYFAEYSLYAKAKYKSSLLARTMADTLELSGHSFADSVKDFPICISSIYKYAQLYIHKTFEASRQGTTTAAKSVALSDVILKEMLHTNELRNSFTHYSEKEIDDEAHHARLDYLALVYDREVSLDDIRKQLDWLFPELDADGIYSHFGESEERDRCKCAILSIIYLHFGAYMDFTNGQKDGLRLTWEQWAELQEIYEWLAIEKDKFAAILVLLAIRGLGKVEAVVRSVPVHLRDPANTVSNLMFDMPQYVPSTCAMEEDMKIFVSRVLDVNAIFNMGQFIQGENNPSDLVELKEFLEDIEYDICDANAFKSYMLVFLGVMCSLGGASSFHSSLHMDKQNAAVVLLAIRCLQDFQSEAPQQLYWSFIKSRANEFSMPVSTEEDYVLARLACLIRAKTDDCKRLPLIWQSLSDTEREQLTSHFLADGIVEEAVQFTFLPSYLINAKNNAQFGLPRALSLLVELLEILYESGHTPRDGTNTIRVSLQSLATFILDVKKVRDIDFLGSHLTFVHHGSVLLVTVSGKMYFKLRDSSFQDDVLQDREVAYALKRLQSRTVGHERALSRLSDNLAQLTSVLRPVHHKPVSEAIPKDAIFFV